MKLLSISEASRLSAIPENTIRKKIADGILKKFEDEKGVALVDKRELLQSIPTVISIYNEKGGCGKTSLSVLLGDYYDKHDIKTLIIDFDQQRSSSKTYFSYEELKDSLTLYNYFEQRTPLNKIIKTYNNNIDIIPSDVKLKKKDLYEMPLMYEMKKAFYSIFKKYNIVIIDCPPTANTFSIFGLILSNYIFLPFVPEPYNYDGIIEALQTISSYTEFMKDFIDYKVVVSAHEQRTIRIQEDYISAIKEEIPNNVIENSIPNFVAIKERPVKFSNIFNDYNEKDKSINKINNTLEEIDRFIYDERGNN